MWRIDRRALLGSLVAVAVTMAAAGVGEPAQAQEKLKIGFVYVSPIGDAGWTYQHDIARLQMEEELGGMVETTIVANVPEGAESERVIRELAASGHKLIFTTSFGYMNPTIKVAKLFPDTVFEHNTGYKQADNVGTYVARFYEGRYLTGLVAGGMTKTNTVGYVAAFPIPEVIRGINAFTIGIREVNPDAEVKVIWVNSWFDPGRERQAADTLIAQGADVITHHTDSTAPTLAAEEAGVWVIAYHSDMSKYGPKAHLTASTHKWGGHYTRIAKAVMDGSWSSAAVWGGIKDDMVEIAPLNTSVPKDLADLVVRKQEQIKAGEFHPFQGPVTDQEGTVRVPDGSVMSDDDLLQMDYYVDGIVGKLPS